jgi:hypothetical protein
MIQRQLPAWARSDNPVLRHILGANGPIDRRTLYIRAAFAALVLGAMVAAGVLVATDFLQEDLFDRPTSLMLFEVIFWPVFVLQIALRLLAVALNIGVVGEEKRRQTWDHMRTTTGGAALAIRARWSAVVFYRLRPALILLTLARLILIAGILYDVTAFSGDYLRYLTGASDPHVADAVGIILLALTMTASLLLPLTGLGFDAALGLLISTFVQERIYTALAQITLAMVRVGAVVLLVLAVTQFRTDGTIEGSSDLVMWLVIAGFAAIGDWGLSLLHLGFYGRDVWATVPYGIYIGAALMTFVLLQTVGTDLMLAWAVRRAERSE